MWTNVICYFLLLDYDGGDDNDNDNNNNFVLLLLLLFLEATLNSARF